LANIEAPALNALIVEAAEQRRRLSISFVNHHSMVTMRQAPHLARDLQDLDVVGADGIAVVMASRLFRRPGLPGRISADLVGPGLLASMEAKGLRLYLLGGEPGVAEAAAGNILQKYPRLHIAGTHHGFARTPEEKARMIAAINATRPEVLWIGLGAPLQERWIAEHGNAVDVPVLMTCGGMLDQTARRLDYYPRWAYRLRLNWLYRLADEPRRLWRRYTVELAEFGAMLLAREWARRGGRQDG